MWSQPLEFGKLTWPEVARAAGEGRVPIVPIGTLEDHGRHLPIDTDVTLVEAAGSLVAASFYLVSERSARVIESVRDSDRGGMAHACELETSLYLHLQPEAVDMAQAVDERGYPAPGHAWMDWSDGPLKLMPWWSSFSESGVQGDATKATAAKGEALFEAATEEIATYVTELRSLPLPRRKEHL